MPFQHLTSQRAAVTVWSAAIAAILLSVAGFGQALMELEHRWSTQEEYSHGYLVPVVAAYMLWARRRAIMTNLGRPSWTGIILIVIALGMHAVGELSAISVLSQVAFVLTLLGISLAVGGFPLFKIVVVPIVFLLFAIPLPYFVDATLSLQLQLISSQLGVFFINLFGIPVYLDGNVIDMGTYKLQVVDACSGLRYLYPLLSLSFIAGYLFHAQFWKRAVVFLSAIPITILMNGFRIGVVGYMVDRFGPQAPDGFLHLFEGWVIFIACAILLAIEIWLFARFSGRKFFDVFYVPTIADAPFQPIADHTWVSRLPVAICYGLLAVIAASGLLVSRQPEIIPERTRFAEFPSRIGDWRGHISLMEPQTEHFLGLDDYILSDYDRADSKVVNLYVAYYASQRKGSSPHSPIVCIPGGGWQINVFERVPFKSPGIDFPMNRVVIGKGTNRQIVYYWFDERGVKIANEWVSKWHLLSDALTKNRTDGALVRLTTALYPGESDMDADKRLHAFAEQLMPKLTSYLPTYTPPVTDRVAYGSSASIGPF